MPSSQLSQCLHCKCLFKGDRGITIHRMSNSVCLKGYLKVQECASRKSSMSRHSKRRHTSGCSPRSKKQTRQGEMPKTQVRDNNRSSDEDSNQSCISFNFTNNDDHHDSSSCNEQDDNLSSTISGSKQTTVSPRDQSNGVIQHDEEQSNILDGSHNIAPNNKNVLPDDSLLEM